jgi:hypothetical protein
VDGQITAIYCLCNDVLKTLHPTEDPQRRMTDAEVVTTAIVAALYFGGNLECARAWLATPSYVPRVLSKSSFNRRLGTGQKYSLHLYTSECIIWSEKPYSLRTDVPPVIRIKISMIQ